MSPRRLGNDSSIQGTNEKWSTQPTTVAEIRITVLSFSQRESVNLFSEKHKPQVHRLQPFMRIFHYLLEARLPLVDIER